jgi:hypothetical protein
MHVFLNVVISPFGKPGEQKLSLWLAGHNGTGVIYRCEVYDGPFLNGALAEDATIETWVIAALRNVSTAVEVEMFKRLTEGQEKLMLTPGKSKPI